MTKNIYVENTLETPFFSMVNTDYKKLLYEMLK